MRYDEHTQQVTARLIGLIQTDTVGVWRMPWHTHGAGDHLRARNATSGVGYRGANVMALALEGIERGYPTGEWATYRQWQGADAQVRRGERSAQIVKWITRRTEEAEVPEAGTGDKMQRQRLIPRVYGVFNAHQVDGYHATESLGVDGSLVAGWIDSIGADVVYGGDRAYYLPGADRIYVPAAGQYDEIDGYYATLIHEHVHWTGHPSRLGRDLGGAFGSPDYAREELVAELGAAIACARLGVSNEPRSDHAAYLAHWLDILREDPKVLFGSAAAAQRAVDFLLAAEPPETTETEKPRRSPQRREVAA